PTTPVSRRVSPGLTTGGGLKPTGSRSRTRSRTVSPGLTTGGGLKPKLGVHVVDLFEVSPGLTTGGGLKPVVHPAKRRSNPGFPRPNHRGRIETSPPCWPGRASRGFPRPNHRGRIETARH